MNNCPHCGMIHQTTCPRIKEIEFYPDGIVVKRIEFHPSQPVVSTNPLRDFVVGPFAGTSQ
jgi:hypothetical protein